MSKRLYTEDDVRRLAPGSELVLGARALATPAALDLAQARGVRVRFDRAPTGGQPSEPARTQTEASSWDAILARDGAYLVHVSGGRPSVYRLEDEGPAPLAVSPGSTGQESAR